MLVGALFRRREAVEETECKETAHLLAGQGDLITSPFVQILKQCNVGHKIMHTMVYKSTCPKACFYH